MILYFVVTNVILAEPIRNKTKEKLISACQKLKKELDKRGFIIKLHVVGNEVPIMHINSNES